MQSSLPLVAGLRLVVPPLVALPPVVLRQQPELPPVAESPVVLLRPACSPARMPYRLRQRA